MNRTYSASALALSLLVAACGGKQDAASENRQVSGTDPTTSQAGATYSGAGEVRSVAGDQVTISHGPIEGIGWPAMTMTFRAGSPEMARSVSAGDRVSFAFEQDGGAYLLTSLSKEP